MNTLLENALARKAAQLLNAKYQMHIQGDLLHRIIHANEEVLQNYVKF